MTDREVKDASTDLPACNRRVEKYYVASLTAKNTILAGSCVYDHVA
jgi:hypothetical protein